MFAKGGQTRKQPLFSNDVKAMKQNQVFKHFNFKKRNFLTDVMDR
jgi:hypothetical protein